jgi:hypothetical protein
MDAARTELTQREGLVQGLRQLEEWLGQAEQRMAEQRRIPLNTGKLSELVRTTSEICANNHHLQKYQDQLERGELEGKERTLAELGSLLRGPRKAGGKEDLAGSVPAELDQQFGTLDSRLRRVGSATRAGSDNLWDAVQAFEVGWLAGWLVCRHLRCWHLALFLPFFMTSLFLNLPSFASHSFS